MPRYQSRSERLAREHISQAQEAEKAGRRLRVVCAWCGVTLVEGDPGAPTSHGCCAKCEQQVINQGGKP